jgi:hypothetical protein
MLVKYLEERLAHSMSSINVSLKQKRTNTLWFCLLLRLVFILLLPAASLRLRELNSSSEPLSRTEDCKASENVA